MSTIMTKGEREAFLALTLVGILSISEAGRGPLAVPVWYSYEPGGEVCIWTGKGTRKYALLQDVDRISFCVQDPTPPFYKYVSVEGPFRIKPVDLERDIHSLALRYYGSVAGERYFSDIKSGNAWMDDILICMTPERWYSGDYSKVSG